jgi:hypothetical protein
VSFILHELQKLLAIPVRRSDVLSAWYDTPAVLFLVAIDIWSLLGLVFVRWPATLPRPRRPLFFAITVARACLQLG